MYGFKYNGCILRCGNVVMFQCCEYIHEMLLHFCYVMYKCYSKSCSGTYAAEFNIAVSSIKK